MNKKLLLKNFISFSIMFTIVLLGMTQEAGALFGIWSGAASMPEIKSLHGQSTLIDGRVLVTGGTIGVDVSKTVYIYNPATDAWSTAASMPEYKDWHGQSTLLDGRVLVTGGSDEDNDTSKTAFMYSPSTDTWSRVNSLPNKLAQHGQSTLSDGRVLVTGGYNGVSCKNTTYIYDPVTNNWSEAARMPERKSLHGQSTLLDGRVLVTGGNDEDYNLSTAHIYNPATNTWSSVASMPVTMSSHGQSTLPDGRVLVTGRNGAYIYSPATDTWSSVSSMPKLIYRHGQSTLLDGKVIITGGYLLSGGYYGHTSATLICIATEPPVMIPQTPSLNEVFHEEVIAFIPQISVSDEDNDSLACKYYIDSETTPRDTKTVTETTTAQTVSFNQLDMSTLSDGNHIIKYEVSDGKAEPVISTVDFAVDKTPPEIGTVTLETGINSISISGSAIDNYTAPESIQYKYKVGLSETNWLGVTTYEKTGLLPNTLYNTIFSAIDLKGHIASKQQTIHTRAKVPVLGIGTTSSYSIELILDNDSADSNPPSTQYQVIVEDTAGGAQYVTPEGTLTQSPVWITSSSDEKITVTGLQPSTYYLFKALARNGDGVETVVGSPVSGTTLMPPPASPTGLIATATSDQITVSWEPIQGATEGYEIMADGNIVDVGTSSIYTHTSLSPGTPHTYQVRAKNVGGPGNWSAQITKSTLPILPDIPANLTAIPQSTSITVTWNNVPGATGYDIDVDGEIISNGPKTNYTHTSLEPGTYHTYKVCSVNSGGRSGWSTLVSVTTKQETSEVPANLTVIPFSNEIQLSWDAVNGATGYDIEVDGVTINNGVKTEYIHKSLSPGSQHMYRIRSKKGSAISDWSSAVIATTLTESFGAPDNLNAVPEDSSIKLSWNVVPGALSYEIEAEGMVINNGPDITAIISGLEPGSIHTYRVRALSDTEISEWSQPLTVTTYELPTPIFIYASSTETEIFLVWNTTGAAITPVWDTTGASVTYDLEADGTIIPEIQDNSYTCSGFVPNSQHVFRVRVRNGDGRSNWSIPLVKSTMFSDVNVPSGLFAIMKNTSTTIVWQPMDGAVSYDIEADSKLIENITDTRYLHTGLLPDSPHTYRVRASNDTSESGWSPLITVSTIPYGPAMPSNLAATSTTSRILVSWDEVTGAEEYQIEVDGVVIENGSGTSYLHSGLSPDTTHTYRVMSRSSAGCSDWSELITLRTKSSTMNYVVDCISGDVLNLVFSASDIQQLGQYTFTISYNANELEVIDLCALTSKIDNTAGNIAGTDIQIVQYSPGTIVFRKTGVAQNYQVWTGVVNTIRFKSRIDGQVNVTYSFQ